MRTLALLFSFFMAVPTWAIDRELLLVQSPADRVPTDKNTSQTSNGLTLDSLGFSANEFQANPEVQKTLQTRTRKLQLHQKLGLLTLALAAATVATAKEGEKAPESHENLGLLTGASYFATAYFSLTAPDAPKTSDQPRQGWNMKVHRAMAFIHFPAMVLMPFAGKQASDAYDEGKSPTGLGKYKKNLAGAAITSMGIAALAVAIDF